VALQDFYQDPDRLKTPIRRKGEEWEAISWDEAFDEITSNLQRIQAQYGKNAVATYLGNPNAHNMGNLLFVPMLFKALGTNNRYSSASADQLPHHVAAHYMLGNGLLIPIPDIDRTDFMLIIGANPMVSNGSLMTAPDFPHRLKAIKERGGKIVVIDPRRTETAEKATEHIFIKPEKDALFLAALIHTIFKENLVKLNHLETIIDGVETIKEAVKYFSPKKVSPIVGIPEAKIRRLAKEMATAKSAVCYSRMGASVQRFGGLCQWLTNVLNVITGNFDREGGVMFTQPAFDFVAMQSNKGKPNSYGRYESRVKKLPFYNGEFPVATLADEILTEGEGQIKGLVAIAGNPVLSSPDGKRLAQAFDNLDFMVAVDIYLNETNRHANIILPAATGLETSHYDVIFHVFAVRNTAKYSPALFPRTAEQRYDWEIMKELAQRLTQQPDQGLTPERILENGLKNGAYAKDGMSLSYLKANPHGVDLGALKPCLVERLQTNDGRIALAPSLLVEDLERLKKTFFTKKIKTETPDFEFALIARRLLRTHNTWTHNSHRLVKGRNECTLLLHPNDALRLNITQGNLAEVTSSTGKIEIEVEISDEIMEGVVSMPQGWGKRNKSGMRVAAAHAGVSINDLTDATRIDTLTGNAAFSGVGVNVRKAIFNH
jgi:anaerobic selenocysteine-containing dehydrogenase